MIRTVSAVELALLCGFAFFLPLAEAPKNIFLFSLLSLWLVNSLRTRNFGHGPFYFWAPLLLIVALSWVSALLVPGPQWPIFLNTIDFLTIAGIAAILGRSSLTKKQIQAALLFVILGVLLSLVEGHLRGGRFPSLKSVGHINQVAIYLSLLTVFFLVSAVSARRVALVATNTCVFLLLLFVTVQTDSRNAIFAVVLSLVLLLVILAAKKQRQRFYWGLGLGVMLAGIGAYLNPSVIEKQIAATKESRHLVDSARLKLWSAAIKVALDKPTLGHGVGNFGAANSPANLQRIVEKSGESYKESDYFFTDHAHNLNLNWLVERGLVALCVFYFWLAYVGSCAWGALNGNRINLFWPLATILIVGASIFSGLGNTSWHHEHGLLAALFIGLGFSNSLRSLALSYQSRV